MEVNNKLVKCEKCNCYYDSAAHAECPVCNPHDSHYPSFVKRCPMCGRYYNSRANSDCPFCADQNPFTDDPAPWQAKCQKCGKRYDSRKYSECPTCRAAEIAEKTVGWLLTIRGSGMGSAFRVSKGYNYIGREVGEIQLPNDLKVSREKHAMVAYSEKSQEFYFGPADGRNIVRLNGEAVFNCTELHSGDVIEVGDTGFKFISLEDARK